MFLSPKIWGCKYTNYFLFINKKPVFQHFGLLITPDRHPSATSWQLLLRLLPDSLYSGSGNVSPCRKTATTVQPFGHFTVRWLISTRRQCEHKWFRRDPKCIRTISHIRIFTFTYYIHFSIIPVLEAVIAVPGPLRLTCTLMLAPFV